MSCRISAKGLRLLAASLLLALAQLACMPPPAPTYSLVTSSETLIHPSVEQHEVITRRGRPCLVLRGPLATTIWIYCLRPHSSYWVEFDDRGNLLWEGRQSGETFPSPAHRQ